MTGEHEGPFFRLLNVTMSFVVLEDAEQGQTAIDKALETMSIDNLKLLDAYVTAFYEFLTLSGETSD